MTQSARNISATSASKDSPAALLRLQQARTYLMSHYPFFSVLALSLKFEESSATESMATDGKFIYWNSVFVLSLSAKQLASVIAHECLHVAFLHHLRRGTRDPYWFNVAADYAINYTLIESGLYDLPDGLYDPKYKGQSAEQIYVDVFEPDDPDDEEDEDKKGSDQKPTGGCGPPAPKGKGKKVNGKGGGDESKDDESKDDESKDDESEGSESEESEDDESKGGSGGKPGKHGPKPKRKPHVGEVWDARVPDQGNRPLTPEEIAEESRDISARVFMAHAEEKAAGTGTAGAYRGVLDDKRSDEIPWGQVLAIHMQELLVTDTSFSKPNRRFIHQGIVLPGNLKRPNGVICFAIDTSGSLSREELNIIAANCNTIVDEIQPIETIIIYCDWSIKRVDRFDFGEPIRLAAYGGGGTRFSPPFNWLTKEEITPDVLVYFTDGYGDVGGSCLLDGGEPEYPVVWASTGVIPQFCGVEEFGELVEIGRIL